jgi:hypothetical protein
MLTVLESIDQCPDPRLADEAAALTRVLAAALRARGRLQPLELEWLAWLERGIAERCPADAVETLHERAMGLLGETLVVEFMVAADHVAAVIEGPERRALAALSVLEDHVNEQLDLLGVEREGAQSRVLAAVG